MADPQREKIRKYFETAWLQVFDEMRCQLQSHGFAPKDKKGKFEIGNKNGQVYAYPAEFSKFHNGLLFLLINPTHTGKLSIKLTFKDSRDFQPVEKKISSMLAAKMLGTPCLNAEGKFVAEYFFFSEPLPADPTKACTMLLETAVTWLKTLTLTED